MKRAMKVSVIICTYNRAETLRDMIGSLESVIVPENISWEVIVVDNNSNDSTRELIASLRSNAALPLSYVFERQQGRSFALNAGIQVAGGDILAFTDDDVTIDPHWLLALTKTFKEFACLGIGGRILPVWPCAKPAWLSTDGAFRIVGPIVYFGLNDTSPRILKGSPMGANMAFRRRAFERYGLFRVDLGRKGRDGRRLGGGGEDTDFGLRLYRAGETLMYAPDALVYHPVEQHRITKKYITAWFYNCGKELTKINGIPGESVCYFGIPRYHFRKLAETFLKAAMSYHDPQERFCYITRCYQTAGEIAESFRMWRDDEQTTAPTSQDRLPPRVV